MNNKSLVILTVMPFILSGCASIMSGTSQDITMHTNPEGAKCILTREGKQLRKIVTADTVRVSKLKYDIDVKCSLDGFYDSTAHIDSGTQGSTFGNILLGGGIGWAIDSARGADNKYADVVTITMVPLSQKAPKDVKIGTDGKVIKQDKLKSVKSKAADKEKKPERVSMVSGKAEEDKAAESKKNNKNEPETPAKVKD